MKRIDILEQINSGLKIPINSKQTATLHEILREAEREIIRLRQEKLNLCKELLDSYEKLLEEAIYLYAYSPNNFRKSAKEYFGEEIKLKEKLSEHYS